MYTAKQYLRKRAMAKKDDKQYWFKAKKYGWGWGLPITWQGRLSFLVFILVWLLAILLILGTADETAHSNSSIALFIGIVVLDVLALLYVSFRYGEPPKWRWGGKNARNKSAKSKPH